jgi:Short C-terminal domain
MVVFGSAERLETELRESGGKTASAQITATKKGKFAISHGNDAAQQAASAHVNWTLTLQVTPDDEALFEAQVKESYPELGGGPSVGDTIGVLYDPNDHSRLVVDHSSEGLATRALSHTSDRMKAAMAQVGGEPAQDMMKEAIDDPAAFREKMKERASQMNANAVASAGTQMPTMVAGGVPVGGAQPDPADEIAKLADLRDRGALTEAEFEAQKKKVLGT